MANHIIYNYAEMDKVVKALHTCATNYKTHGTGLVQALGEAFASCSGPSVEAFKALVGDVSKPGSVAEYVEKIAPELITGMEELLMGNGTAMQEADNQVAQSIPKSL